MLRQCRSQFCDNGLMRLRLAKRLWCHRIAFLVIHVARQQRVLPIALRRGFSRLLLETAVLIRLSLHVSTLERLWKGTCIIAEHIDKEYALCHKEGSMFSIRQKRHIADEVQQLLRATGHPELPKGEIEFLLHVKGAAPWAWANIQNNGGVIKPEINPWNEAHDIEGADDATI